MHKAAAEIFSVILPDKILSGPIRRIKPENPRKNPIHFFLVILSLRTILASSKIKRGIDDKYMATSPVVIVFRAKGIRMKGSPRQKIP